jgi:hypothetical protein
MSSPLKTLTFSEAGEYEQALRFENDYLQYCEDVIINNRDISVRYSPNGENILICLRTKQEKLNEISRKIQKNIGVTLAQNGDILQEIDPVIPYSKNILVGRLDDLRILVLSSDRL